MQRRQQASGYLKWKAASLLDSFQFVWREKGKEEEREIYLSLVNSSWCFFISQSTCITLTHTVTNLRMHCQQIDQSLGFVVADLSGEIVETIVELIELSKEETKRLASRKGD